MERANRVILNIGMLDSQPKNRPEPDLPMLTIDGIDINNVVRVSVEAGAQQPTVVSLVLYAEVGGFVGQQNIADEIERLRKDKHD